MIIGFVITAVILLIYHFSGVPGLPNLVGLVGISSAFLFLFGVIDKIIGFIKRQPLIEEFTEDTLEVDEQMRQNAIFNLKKRFR